MNSYNDLTPRAAVTYDLFGNGKTALKATLGKYLESTVTASNYGLGNPTSRIATNVTRTWTDRNGNWRAGLQSAATRRRRTSARPATSAASSRT